MNSWHKSCERTLLQARTYWFHGVLKYFDWVTGLVHRLRVKYWQCLFADNFEANGKASMRAHYSEIRNLAQQREAKILEFNLGDEWEHLCEFLNVDIPDHPYPRENEGGNWILKMKERARMRAKAAACKFLRLSLPITIFSLGVWCTREKFSLSFKELGREQLVLLKSFDFRL